MDFKEYEDDIIRFYYAEGIMYVTYKVKKVDLQVANHTIETKIKLLKGEGDFPVFADYKNVIETTKEAREKFVTPESILHSKAMAILVESMVGSIMYNFFMKINKPQIPTRVFKDSDKAVKWLEKFK